ncbi:MAG: hypothetical protein M3Q30_10395 [Actinomycetota bacterium]|nr:hypothetical protein [Actinomycetota bacterium]
MDQLIRWQVRAWLAWSATTGALRARASRDERGEISSTVIIIAILCALAISAGAIIVAKVTAKANSTPTGG